MSERTQAPRCAVCLAQETQPCPWLPGEYMPTCSAQWCVYQYQGDCAVADMEGADRSRTLAWLERQVQALRCEARP